MKNYSFVYIFVGRKIKKRILSKLYDKALLAEGFHIGLPNLFSTSPFEMNLQCLTWRFFNVFVNLLIEEELISIHLFQFSPGHFRVSAASEGGKGARGMLGGGSQDPPGDVGGIYRWGRHQWPPSPSRLAPEACAAGPRWHRDWSQWPPRMRRHSEPKEGKETNFYLIYVINSKFEFWKLKKKLFQCFDCISAGLHIFSFIIFCLLHRGSMTGSWRSISQRRPWTSP